MSRILDVYIKGDFVGKLIQNYSGSLSFAYDAAYDAAYVQADKMALSLSLPLQKEAHDSDAVKAFFSGLLPDEILRQKIAKYLGVSEKNPFALLENIGGECAGALSLFSEGNSDKDMLPNDITFIDDDDFKSTVDDLKRHPLRVGEKGERLSLAGAQDKLPVVFKGGRIALVRGNEPTTHIIKPSIGIVQDSIYNELFCMRLAGLVGIDVPHTQIYTSNDMSCFLIRRYDREANEDGGVTRIHQEDFCQALGLLPDNKYENEGGPSFQACQELIARHSARPASDQIKLINRLIFNYLIGNADAHGKNFSFLYEDKKPALAPAYDLLSTEVYPDLAKKMAMKIGGKYKPDDVYLRHWHRIVPDTKTAKKNVEAQLLEMSVKVSLRAQKIKRDLEKEGVSSSTIDEILKVIEIRAARIQKEL